MPGLLMAAARLNIPTVFVSGGPMLAGRVGGKKTSLSSMFEATFFSLSLNLAIRSSWSEPQSAPGLVFADCIELLHLWLQRI